jgi:hypothetical protein
MKSSMSGVALAARQLPRRSVASELFAHWVDDTRSRDRSGKPRVLRVGLYTFDANAAPEPERPAPPRKARNTR